MTERIINTKRTITIEGERQPLPRVQPPRDDRGYLRIIASIIVIGGLLAALALFVPGCDYRDSGITPPGVVLMGIEPDDMVVPFVAGNGGAKQGAAGVDIYRKDESGNYVFHRKVEGKGLIVIDVAVTKK